MSSAESDPQLPDKSSGPFRDLAAPAKKQKSRWWPVNAKRGRDGWEVQIFWRRVAVWLVCLALAGWLGLSAAAWGFVRYYRDVPTVDFLHIACPWLWQEYREVRAEHYFQCAREMRSTSQWRGAFVNLIASLDKNPAHRQARLDLAHFYAQVRRYDLAEKTLLDGLNHHGADSGYLTNVFQFLVQLQNDPKAIEVADTILKRSDTNDACKNTAAYWAAIAHFYRGNFDRAEDLLRTGQLYLTRETRILTTKIEWERGYPELVLILLEQLTKEYPQDDEITSLLASRYRALGQTSRARSINVLRQFNNPTAPKPRVDLLQLYTDIGETALAQREIDDFFRDFSEKQEALMLLGEYAANNGRPPLARRIYEHCRQKDLPWEGPALLAVEADIVAGHYQAALEATRELVNANPEWGRRYYSLFNGFQAIAYHGLGDKDAASLYLRNFLGQASVRSEQLSALSRRLDAAGAHSDARAVLVQAITNDPLNQAALTHLIQLDLRTRQLSEIPALIGKLLSMRRPSPQLLRDAYNELSSDRWYFLDGRADTLRKLSAALSQSSKASAPQHP